MQIGHCLCGEIEFGVEGQPNDVINCHCNFCQRAISSAYLVETIFDRDKFHLLRGQPQVYDHVSEGSGKVIHIRFRGACGTKTHMLFDRFPASVGVFSGTFAKKTGLSEPAKTHCISISVLHPKGQYSQPALRFTTPIIGNRRVSLLGLLYSIKTRS